VMLFVAAEEIFSERFGPSSGSCGDMQARQLVPAWNGRSGRLRHADSNVHDKD